MKKPSSIIFISFITMSLILFSSFLYAAKKHSLRTINILTWWGYFNYPQIINSAEKRCNAKISFDQYYSNEEFLRRWREQKDSYDIIIFSNTIFNVIKSEIKNINSNLWKQSNNYNPIIKHYYLKNKYPKNIVYFAHTLTGFLYNSKSISLYPTDSIFTMFKKSQNKIVVIMDEPVEANKLLTLGFKNSNYSLGNFKRLYQDSNLYIENGFNNIYKSSDFAFAFLWSGDGIRQIKESGLNLQFLIHPNLSYISSDLLAQINKNKTSECVANYLSSEMALRIIENNYYYFSSYTNIKHITDHDFYDIYRQFLQALPKLKWIESVNTREFNKLTKSWDSIKLDLIRNNKVVEQK